MIGVWSLLIAFVLLLLLLLVGVKGTLTDQLEQASDATLDNQDSAEACPPQLAVRIFAREDWEFVSRMRSSGIEALFQKERKGLAVFWVQQTALGIRQVMREHAKVARRSRDLEMRTEVKLFWQYSELMLVCAALIVLIQIAGQCGWAVWQLMRRASPPKLRRHKGRSNWLWTCPRLLLFDSSSLTAKAG